ncbi:MAG: glycine zipper 2TM domain-containing protein [Phenylobacterium sp.]|nr:glycine zipper 2TM domain-containing protein [Phenylobacterium sp.]
MRNLVLAVTVAAFTVPALPAAADPPPWAPAHGKRHNDHHRYDRQGRYVEPVSVGRDRVWRGNDGRYYCKRDNGTTGLVIGAAVGALVGRQVDGGDNRTAGTILGAVGGGLLGREIDRGPVKCR